MLRVVRQRLRTTDPRHLAPGAAAFAAASLVALLGLKAGADPSPRVQRPSAAQKPPASGLVSIQLLGVNDWHGHFQPPQIGRAHV